MVGLYNRKISFHKALRKQNIVRHVYWHGKEYPWYDNLHQYSKNKIHCSCPMCSCKTNNGGKNRKSANKWSPTYNPSMKDLRKQMSMKDELKEYYDNERDEFANEDNYSA